ncbi:hypothetical protein QJS10_CPA10g00845 [Acorus calamus]|uniref:Reverse transcriptase zinc-binding domain-containing protein n=1 Tax=Acorus calamus TaxID=4465 RepID=A0AAV9DWH2_ACOCL|nr:hypothetical protein QJS10_CPA10g00845 [Acorus calamus]
MDHLGFGGPSQSQGSSLRIIARPTISTTCILCNGGMELVDHIFRECAVAKDLWARLGALCNHHLD